MKKEQKIGLIVLAVSLILNLFLSLYKLDFSIWLDEAVSIKFASLNFFDIPSTIMISHTHVPIYFLILNIWIKVFGTSEIACRMLSIIFGLISIILFYFILEIMNTKKSYTTKEQNPKNQNKLSNIENYLSIILISISYSIIQQQRDTRMYTLSLMFATITTLIFALYVRFDKKIFLVFYTITSILFVYTHVYAVYLFPIHILFIFVTKRKNIKKNLPPLTLSYLLIIISMIPIFIYLSKLTQAVFLLNPLSFERFMGIIYGLFLSKILGIIWIVVLFLSLIGSYFLNRFKFNTTLFTLIIFLMPFVFILIYEAIFNNVFKPKYIIYLFPIAVLLISKTISNSIDIIYFVGMKLYQKMQFKWVNLYSKIKKTGITSKQFLYSISILSIILFSSAMGVTSFNRYSIYYQNPEREDWKGMASYIDENGYSNDTIFIEAGICDDPFMYYYDKFLPNNMSIVTITFENTTTTMITNSIEVSLNNSRVWYILSHSRDYDDEIYNWALSLNYIKEYLSFKAIRLLLLEH